MPHKELLSTWSSADKTTRWLRESIWIRSRGEHSMNKDEGAYTLNRIFDQLITQRQPISTRDDTRQANKTAC